MKVQFYPRPNAAWFGREPVEVTMASMFHSVRRTLVFFLLLLAAVPLHAQQTGRDPRQGHVRGRRGAAGRDDLGALRRAAAAARDGVRGGRRVPAAGAAAGQLHARVRALGHADRDAQGGGPARAADAPRRGARRQHQRDDHGDRRVVGDRQGLGDDRLHAQQRPDRRPAARAGLPRPAEADPGRAVHAGRDPRPERGRQRPGQRLQLRRRQRDACRSTGRSRPSPRPTTSPRSP